MASKTPMTDGFPIEIEICTCFINQFNKLFKTSQVHPLNYDQNLAQLYILCISPKENDELCSIPNSNEIKKKVVFSMGSWS